MSQLTECHYGYFEKEVFPYILGAIGVFIVAGNSLVIAAIYKCRKLHTHTNILVFGLAATDLLTGLVAVPLKIKNNECFQSEFYPCILMSSVIYMIANVSILCVLGINLDRLFSVRYPVKYRREATIKRALEVVGAYWTIGISIGMISVFMWNQKDHYHGLCSFDNVVAPEYLALFQLPVMFLLPISIISISNIFLIKRIKRKASTRHEAHEGKAKRLVVVITLVFVICWLPINIEHFIWYYYGHRIFVDVKPVAVSLYFLNSAINPLVYALCNSKIRTAICCILMCRNINRTRTISLEAKDNVLRHALNRTPNHIQDGQNQTATAVAVIESFSDTPEYDYTSTGAAPGSGDKMCRSSIAGGSTYSTRRHSTSTFGISHHSSKTHIDNISIR